MKKLTFLFIALSLVALTGCAAFQKKVITTDPKTGITTTNTVTDIDKVASTVKQVAKLGTQAAIVSNPDLADGFTKAAAELNRLELQDQIDLNDALLIVERLDPNALKTQEARIYVSG